MDWLSQFLASLGQGQGAPGASMTDFGDSGPAPSPQVPPPMPVPALNQSAEAPPPRIGGAPSLSSGQIDPMGGSGESSGLPSLGASLQPAGGDASGAPMGGPMGGSP